MRNTQIWFLESVCVLCVFIYLFIFWKDRRTRFPLAKQKRGHTLFFGGMFAMDLLVPLGFCMRWLRNHCLWDTIAESMTRGYHDLVIQLLEVLNLHPPITTLEVEFLDFCWKVRCHFCCTCRFGSSTSTSKCSLWEIFIRF